jgi:hypothetical protein
MLTPVARTSIVDSHAHPLRPGSPLSVVRRGGGTMETIRAHSEIVGALPHVAHKLDMLGANLAKTALQILFAKLCLPAY